MTLTNYQKNPLKWGYSKDVGHDTNSHCALFSDMCELLPLNHSSYSGKYCTGGYTYFKSNKKSQIDYVITNNYGRAKINKFKITETGWHMPDHLPIGVEIHVETMIDVHVLLVRFKLLLESGPKETPRLNIFMKKFNVDEAKAILAVNVDNIIKECENKSADEILNAIYYNLDLSLEKTIIVKEREITIQSDVMKDCNRLFQ